MKGATKLHEMIKYKFKLYKNAFKIIYGFPKKLDLKHFKKNGNIPTTFQD